MERPCLYSHLRGRVIVFGICFFTYFCKMVPIDTPNASYIGSAVRFSYFFNKKCSELRIHITIISAVYNPD